MNIKNKKAEVRFIVAVEVDGQRGMFGFPTEKDRDNYINDLKKIDPNVFYITTEVPEWTTNKNNKVN